MKMHIRSLCFLLLLVLLLPLLPQAQATQGSTLNAMSYNLKNTNYSFGKVADMALQQDADIVCMQEVCSLQKIGMTSAMKSAGYEAMEGKSSGSNSITEADEYLPIYYRASKYTLLRSGTFWLSDTGSVQSKFEGSSYFRICSWAYFQVTGTEEYFMVFNTHLDFKVDVMIKQLDCLLHQIIVKSGELIASWDNIILAGDLNASNISVVCRYLQGDVPYDGVLNPHTKQRLDEARQIASNVTFNKFGNTFTQPASDPTMDLDHIYITSKGWHCDSYEVLSDAVGSDHLPVIARLRFRAEHNYQYTWMQNGQHRRSCTHCRETLTEGCTMKDGYCTLCGGATGERSFTLVKNGEALTDGRYLIVSAAVMGPNTGEFAYYAAAKKQDSGFNAINSVGMPFTDLPDSITLQGAELASLVWTFEGSPRAFTLSGENGAKLSMQNGELFLGNYAPTIWYAEHSAKHYYAAVKYTEWGYLALRTDLPTLSCADSATPLFGCVGNTDTGNFKIIFYKENGACMHENLSTEVTAPSCTEHGYTRYACPDCGYTRTDDYVPAKGHSYQSVVTPPTTESQGYTTHTCTSCADSYTDNYVDALECYTLSFSVPEGVEQPQALMGTTGLVLPGVSGTPRYAPEGTQFVGWVTASYDNLNDSFSGTKIFKEGVSVTVSMDVTLHALFSYQKGEGVTERIFTLHDGSSSMRIGDSVILVASEHDFAMGAAQNGDARSAVAVTKRADSTISITDGTVAIFTLAWGVEGNAEKNRVSFQDTNGYLCAAEEPEGKLTSKATLDAYGSWSVNRNTSTQNMTFTSQGVSQNNVIRYFAERGVFATDDASEQSPIQIYIQTVQWNTATHYTTAFHKEQCTHMRTELTGAYPASCEKMGYTGDTVCSDCGKIMSKGSAITALGHFYTYTPVEHEMHLCRCSACGDSYTESCLYADGECVCGAVELATDESIKINHSLNLASDISINYVIKSELLAQYDSYYLEVIMPVYKGNTLTGTETVLLQPELRGTNYYFILNGLISLEMNNIVEATLHMGKNGRQYVSRVDRYSIGTYAYNQLNGENKSEALKAMCANLLRYGAKAQLWKGYRTDALVDANMTEAHRMYLNELDGVVFGNNNRRLADVQTPVITWGGKALMLDSKIVVRYVFNATNYTGDLSKLSLRVSFVNINGATENVVLTGPVLYDASRSFYSFDFDGLLAAELRTVMSVAVYEGDTQLSETLEYSVDTFGNGKTGTLLTVLQAMVAYSDSAKAFFSA